MSPLYILPFDHRSSFLKIMGVSSTPTDEELALARRCKNIIYQGLMQAISLGVPKKDVAILVDEWLGSHVLEQANEDNVATSFPLEKSGSSEFVHEYVDWQQKILDLKPTYAKVLIRYNPLNKEVNQRQQRQLIAISHFLSSCSTKFLLELLVPPTDEQASDTYDNELRPQLTIQAIQELYGANILPDIWKLEGVISPQAMQDISLAVASKGSAQIVILGRGQDDNAVEQWLKIGAKANNSVGFAVGRTIFKTAIEQYVTHTCTEEEAITNVAKKFFYFFSLWLKEKNQMMATSSE